MEVFLRRLHRLTVARKPLGLSRDAVFGLCTGIKRRFLRACRDVSVWPGPDQLINIPAVSVFHRPSKPVIALRLESTVVRND